MKIEIPAIFSNNMVLQQKSNVPFWGKAAPGLQVTLKTSWGAAEETLVKPDSSFMLNFKTPKAGGPHTVDLQIGDTAIHYSNVLTGEVWLCSGQSNMEMPLMGWPPGDTITNSDYEIRNANYPLIRFATVQHAFSNEKQFNCVTAWQECTPQTAETFSATAYFFGKKLFKELNVPIGLIHSSWGGTPVEAWTGAEYLSQFEKYKPVIEKLNTAYAELEQYKLWLSSHPVIDVRTKDAAEKWKGLDFFDAKCSAVDLDDSAWQEINLPALWETSGVGNFDGVIWFRKTIALPDTLKGKDLILSLGTIDDIDRTYVNGILVGAHETDGQWQTERMYKIPAALTTVNEIKIAVRVLDMRGGGGIFGDAAKMKLLSPHNSDFISIAGNWKYMPVAEYREDQFYLLDPEQNEYSRRPLLSIDLSALTPTSLYNAMIHPLIPFAIKGVIWYQGESNTDMPELYQSLFTTMISNWRKEWAQGDFPFYYAQIAPYNYGSITHSERLREAQLKASSFKNTGMIVTLDIGNPVNIHPANKKDVGDRLANYALAKDYDKDVPFSGPVLKKMKVSKNKIELSFDHSEFMHIKTISGKNNFTIAGQDRIFRDAEIEIKDDKVIVFNADVPKPEAVRYAWSNTAEATLFNGYGLPASSFRTDDWEPHPQSLSF